MEIVTELKALDLKLRPLLDRKAALEAERDVLWPPELPAPAQLNQTSREVAEAAVQAVEAMAPLVVRSRGAIRMDGPTAQPRVLAYVETRPGEWLKARQICEGMGLNLVLIQAVRASLDRLVRAGSIRKNEAGAFRLASNRPIERSGTEATR